MADDGIVRSYRSNDAARRGSAPPASRDIPSRDVGGSDPLAELARLIGQNDPFADLNSGPSADTRQRADAPQSDWRRTAAALARESMRNPPAADAHYDQVDSALAAARSLRASPDDRFGHHDMQPGYDQDPRAPGGYADSGHADSGYADSGYADRAYADSAYDDAPRGGSRADDLHYGDHRADAQHGAAESENYFFDGEAAPADERFYDDPPRARTTNSLLTVAVLIGCGILGTAGAYGYRTYYSGAHPTDAPIIPAEKSPIKVMPAQADSGKPVQERLGEGNERLVTRQEEPVTLSDPGGPSGPRGVLPAPFTPSPGPGPSAGAPTPSGGAGEPKKVRTVAIRPEGAVDPMARPVIGTPPPQTAPSAPVVASRQPPAAKSAPPPARGSTGPLSIDPQTQPVSGDPASAYPPASRAAPAPAPAPAPGPRLASAPPSTAAGGYVVQISSQRSEADAQASFQSLQAKYPRELGDREPIVRRADLGPKGIYYRAMVGPFATAGDADQLCSNLKAAGGQCIVQKN
ncbi:MAG TPA: SPOR domain-containing protein [Xanthobacteraceae bacterium]